MRSSAVVAFRALVMIACMIAIPSVALFWKSWPDILEAVLNGRLPKLVMVETSEPSRHEAPRGGDAPPYASFGEAPPYTPYAQPAPHSPYGQAPPLLPGAQSTPYDGSPPVAAAGGDVAHASWNPPAHASQPVQPYPDPTASAQTAAVGDAQSQPGGVPSVYGGASPPDRYSAVGDVAPPWNAAAAQQGGPASMLEDAPPYPGSAAPEVQATSVPAAHAHYEQAHSTEANEPLRRGERSPEPFGRREPGSVGAYGSRADQPAAHRAPAAAQEAPPQSPALIAQQSYESAPPAASPDANPSADSAAGGEAPPWNTQMHPNLTSPGFGPATSADNRQMHPAMTDPNGMTAPGQTPAHIGAPNVTGPLVQEPQEGAVDRFAAMERRLRELGATYYLLETWGDRGELYRFHAKMALSGNPRYNRHFEATDAHAMTAMHRVLDQVEAWRAGRAP